MIDGDVKGPGKYSPCSMASIWLRRRAGGREGRMIWIKRS